MDCGLDRGSGYGWDGVAAWYERKMLPNRAFLLIMITFTYHLGGHRGFDLDATSRVRCRRGSRQSQGSRAPSRHCAKRCDTTIEEARDRRRRAVVRAWSSWCAAD